MKVTAGAYTSFETPETPAGTLGYLLDPQSVIALIQSGNLRELILPVQGGTTTFSARARSHRGVPDLP